MTDNSATHKPASSFQAVCLRRGPASLPLISTVTAQPWLCRDNEMGRGIPAARRLLGICRTGGGGREGGRRAYAFLTLDFFALQAPSTFGEGEEIFPSFVRQSLRSPVPGVRAYLFIQAATVKAIITKALLNFPSAWLLSKPIPR